MAQLLEGWNDDEGEHEHHEPEQAEDLDPLAHHRTSGARLSKNAAAAKPTTTRQIATITATSGCRGNEDISGTSNVMTASPNCSQAAAD